MKARLVVIFAAYMIGPALAVHAHDHVQIARQNTPAVVTVNILKEDGSTHTATGFVLTEDGIVATNRHSIKEALFLNLTFNNGVTSAQATPIAQSDLVDLALLKVQAQHLPHVTLGNSSTVEPGQTITVIGNPRRLQNTVTSGLISQLRKHPNGTLWFQISAPLSPSSSGSPVFDEHGHVIAVAFGSLAGEENQNLNFAIPVHYLTQLLAEQHVPLPQISPTPDTENFLIRHVKQSWQILKQLLRQWFSHSAKDEL